MSADIPSQVLDVIRATVSNEVRAPLLNLGVLNVSYGNNTNFYGMRNVTFGDDLTVVGDYKIVIGQKATTQNYASEDEKNRVLEIYRKSLDFYKELDADGVSPNGFYDRAKIVIEIICALVAASPVPEDRSGPKIEEVKEASKEEPTSMKK